MTSDLTHPTGVPALVPRQDAERIYVLPQTLLHGMGPGRICPQRGHARRTLSAQTRGPADGGSSGKGTEWRIAGAGG